MGYNILEQNFIPLLGIKELSSCDEILEMDNIVLSNGNSRQEKIPFKKRWHFTMNQYVRLIEVKVTELQKAIRAF